MNFPHRPLTTFRSFAFVLAFLATAFPAFSQAETPKQEADRLMVEAADDLKEKRADDLIRKATRILELFPNSGDVYAMRGMAYLLKQDSDGAKVDFTSVINSPTAKSQMILIARRMRGMINYQSKQYEDAISDLTVAMAISPGNVGDHSFRGWSHFFLKRYKEAIADFDKAIEINPKGTGVYRFRAQAHLNLGNYSLAVDDITEELKVNPSPLPETYKIRANAYRQLGKVDLAKADEDAYEKATRAEEKPKPDR